LTKEGQTIQLPKEGQTIQLPKAGQTIQLPKVICINVIDILTDIGII
jgi:hypothetical protein